MKCPYSIIDLTLPNVDTPRLRSLGEIIKLASDCIDRIRYTYTAYVTSAVPVEVPKIWRVKTKIEGMSRKRLSLLILPNIGDRLQPLNPNPTGPGLYCILG